LIAIDARYVRERPSGIGSMVAAIVERVPRLLPKQDFLLLTHPFARRPLSTASNVREIVVPAEANGPGTLFALPRLVDLSSVRLFHATFNILPRGLRMPSVATVHDIMWLTDPELCRSPGLWGKVETAFYQHGIRTAIRDATRLLSVSETTKGAIAALDPAAAERCVVVLHGLDAAFRPANTPEERDAVEASRRKHAPGAERYVLCVGQASRYKNHAGVLEAFLRAFPSDPAIHLVFVQRLGNAAEALLLRAREGGARDRVHVLPTLPFEDLLSLYRGALCLCHPSFVEGWGMPVSEALGTGCPVITSETSSMPEVAGGAALLVDPHDVESIADALRRTRDDEAMRRSMIERGLVRARAFDWDVHAQRTADVYERLVDRRAG
jgi:glycosyltransferase involved in cell wall biosynthesis